MQKVDVKYKLERQFNHHLQRWCIVVDVNFYIPEAFMFTLSLRPGMELIQSSTRYQFVCVIGKLFDVSQMENSIVDFINNWEQ